jgi:hypothetical protein
LKVIKLIEITDVHNVSVAIRDAVAPVFLLTGIGSILGVITGRLVRAIDRARHINGMECTERDSHKIELKIVVSRITWLRRAIGLATLAALSVCVSIATLFVSVESGISLSHVVMWSFIASMGSVILSLMCFLFEIILTSQEVIVDSKRDKH